MWSFEDAYIHRHDQRPRNGFRGIQGESAETKDADIKSFVDKSCGEIKLM